MKQITATLPDCSDTDAAIQLLAAIAVDLRVQHVTGPTTASRREAAAFVARSQVCQTLLAVASRVEPGQPVANSVLEKALVAAGWKAKSMPAAVSWLVAAGLARRTGRSVAFTATARPAARP